MNIGEELEIELWFSFGRKAVEKGLMSLMITHNVSWQPWPATPTISYLVDPRYPEVTWFRWMNAAWQVHYSTFFRRNEPGEQALVLRTDTYAVE